MKKSFRNSTAKNNQWRGKQNKIIQWTKTKKICSDVGGNVNVVTYNKNNKNNNKQYCWK